MIGGPGTSKAAIAASLAKEGYIIEREEPLPLTNLAKNALELQTSYLLRRWRLQRSIQKRAKEEDIVQVRTFWDTHEVYSQALLERRYLTVRDHWVLSEFYKALSEGLEAPSVVVYLKTSKIDALDRMALSGGGDMPEEYFDLVRAAYDTFARKLRMPPLEVDPSQPFDRLMDNLRGELTSMKAGHLTSAATIWQRDFLLEHPRAADD